MFPFLACRSFLRPGLKVCAPSICGLERVMALNTSVTTQTSETFIEKNERLKRPLSPHLTIYKPQLTSMLSITHRATGITLSTGLYGLSLSTLVMSSPFPQYFEYFQSLQIATPLIFSFKFALAWMVFFHASNGIRHLFWDMGYGYDIKTLYMSGYAVVGVSLMASLIAASM